jgi:hypothetical protein
MITKFNEYNGIIDTSGSMSNVVIDPFINDFVSKIEIYEVDDFDDSNYTGNVIIVNFSELKKLIDLELVVVKNEYIYLSKNSDKIKEFLELERDTKKYNL